MNKISGWHIFAGMTRMISLRNLTQHWNSSPFSLTVMFTQGKDWSQHLISQTKIHQCWNRIEKSWTDWATVRIWWKRFQFRTSFVVSASSGLAEPPRPHLVIWKRTISYTNFCTPCIHCLKSFVWSWPNALLTCLVCLCLVGPLYNYTRVSCPTSQTISY